MKALRRAFLACLAAAFCACNRPNRFPIGLYAVNSPADLAAVRAAGFDTIQTYRQDPGSLAALAREAKRLGLSVLFYPHSLKESPPPQDWPVLAWYLQDEPDVHIIPPEQLRATAERVKRWDPRRAGAFVVGEGRAAAPYAGIADILMLDWYPVPHLPLDSVADQLDEAARHIPAGKPLWMVIQSFDWRDYPQRNPRKPRIGRFPDQAEIRFMSYLSVLHGAAGLFYFSLEKNGRTLLDYPELWQAVRGVAQEMRNMQPIWENGRRIALPFQISGKGLEAQAWRCRGRDYVVIVNRKKDFFEPAPRELLSLKWRPLFETRRYTEDILEHIRNDYYFRPYQVTVFEGPLGF